MTITLNDKNIGIFKQAIEVMAEFRRTFGRELKPDFVAELYAAYELGLEVFLSPNEPGYDAVDPTGKRYEIKERNAQNVDLNSFNFDYLILVNLDEDYHLLGMWKLSRERAQSIFVKREKFKKYQATQDKVKANAIKIL